MTLKPCCRFQGTKALDVDLKPGFCNVRDGEDGDDVADANGSWGDSSAIF